MNPVRKSFAPVFAAIVAGGLLIAIPISRGDPASQKAVPHFANLAGADFAAALPAPPAAGSLAAAADIETVLQVQAWRTPEQVAWARSADVIDTFALASYVDLLGPKLTRENLPCLAKLMSDCKDDLSGIFQIAQQKFARLRPFVVDTRVQLLVRKPSQYSYPSGHSYRAYLTAAILAEVFPEKRAELFEQARRIAWSRVIGGAHFPTDLEGGRRLAEAVVAAELQTQAFLEAIGQCRREASSGMIPIESATKRPP